MEVDGDVVVMASKVHLEKKEGGMRWENIFLRIQMHMRICQMYKFECEVLEKS